MVGCLLGTLVLFSGTSPKPGPTIGSAAQEFRLPGIHQAEISLQQFKGKVVVLNFWATWCAPCQEEMPVLEGVSKTFGDRIVVVGVNSQESESRVSDFIHQNQITFPVALDGSGELANLYLVNHYPTTFFIDSKGILRSLHIGQMNEQQVYAYLRETGVED